MVVNLLPEVIIELYIKAFLVGVAFGAVWDIVRFIKMTCGVKYGGDEKNTRLSRMKWVFLYILSFVFDVLFWVSLGIASILLFYNVSGGYFRASAYPCLLFGLALYYFSFGRVTLVLSARFIALLKKIFAFAIRLVGVPLRAARRAIIFVYHLTIGKLIGKIKGRIIENRERRRMLEAPDEDGQREEAAKSEEGRLYRREGRIRF